MAANHRRILLKVSGEALINHEKGSFCEAVALILKDAILKKKQIGLVIGGGNIIRGLHVQGKMERNTADHIGMLATLINALSFKEVLEKIVCPVKVFSAIKCDQIVEKYFWKKADDYLNNGYLVILAGGTSNPYFSTDSAAALRACELKADILLKATKVDGVYDKDPHLFSDARKLDIISYFEYLQRRLKVMDMTAVSLCMENNLPIKVFDLFSSEGLKRALLGETVGSLIHGEGYEC
jgi:uridylate kinase